MKQVFFIFGYGVPKDILHDTQYSLYLYTVFNYIYRTVAQDEKGVPLILCSGGLTDCFPPYKRNEADEMIRLLRTISERPFVRQRAKHWNYIPEKDSLSTLENLLRCKEVLKRKRIKDASITIFCEYTRERRVKRLAKDILNTQGRVHVVPIDFDISSNRYLDPKLIAKKERMVLQHELWALQDPIHLKKHHALFEEKLAFLRSKDPSDHPKAIREWWLKVFQQWEKQL